jgi:Flp pilus assembly protein TadD
MRLTRKVFQGLPIAAGVVLALGLAGCETTSSAPTNQMVGDTGTQSTTVVTNESPTGVAVSEKAANAMAADLPVVSRATEAPIMVADASGTTAPPTTVTVEEPATVKYFPSDEPLRMALEMFNRGNYGLAERYFRDAVERNPRDVTAWVGLAASYDRLARFDLADRAYRFAIKLGGQTTQVLNNQGYSYMLRGNYARARQLLLRAQAREPNNPVIANNLALLDGSRQFAIRNNY